MTTLFLAQRFMLVCDYTCLFIYLEASFNSFSWGNREQILPHYILFQMFGRSDLYLSFLVKLSIGHVGCDFS